MAIELIKVIKKAEDKAELLKSEAVINAKQIVSNSSKQASLILDDAMKNADLNTQKVLEKAEAEAKLLYDCVINDAVIECDKILTNSNKNMDNAASIILERIVN